MVKLWRKTVGKWTKLSDIVDVDECLVCGKRKYEKGKEPNWNVNIALINPRMGKKPDFVFTLCPKHRKTTTISEAFRLIVKESTNKFAKEYRKHFRKGEGVHYYLKAKKRKGDGKK